MKKLISTFTFLLITTAVFSQQEMQIVNNTGQNINVFLIAYGDSSTFGCDSCGNSLESDVFVIPTGTTILDAFSDTATNWTGNPPWCTNSFCTPGQADGICGNPIWELIGFSDPGGSGCCVARIGNISSSCGGYNDFYTDGTFSASWTYVSANEILVVFN